MFFLLLGGCVQPAAPSRSATPIERVVYEPAILGRWLMVGDGETEREGGSRRLRVRVPLVNEAPEPLKLRVRIQFLDGRGNSHGDDTALRCVAVPAGGSRWMQATSLDAGACYYCVWVEWVAEKP